MKDPIFILELPMSERETKGMVLASSTCRWLFGSQSESEGLVACFSEVLQACCPKESGIYITPVGACMEVEKLEGQEGVDIFRLSKDVSFAHARSNGALERLITAWNAEALVAFFSTLDIAKEICMNVSQMNKGFFWTFKRGWYHHDYLAQADLCRLFFFYSSTHTNIEIMGAKDEIIRCLRCAKGHMEAFVKESGN